ncbi:DUF4868 domain-containing protein, partial [Salmonella enterica subsp. enterica]|nr:DUF4868 domain-containing protein [Salmonella enterica subsp. enterica]ECI5043581.1 DUF4868 domain-containing protein [Salmonella enterica subsp. enterica]
VVNDQAQQTVGLYRVRLEQQAETDLTASFVDSLTNVVIEPNNGKTSVPQVSTLVDRDKQVFEYDHQNINHLPQEFTLMDDVSSSGVNSNIPYFDFSNQNIRDIKGVIYHVCDGNGGSIVIYQHKYTVSLHRRTTKSFFSLNGRTLGTVDYDVIDINNTIDFFYFNGVYYAINISLLERSYGLKQVIDNIASLITPDIINLNIINTQGMSNPNDLFLDMYNDRSFMRRLAMVARGSIVQNGITIGQVQSVMSQFPVLGRELTINNGLLELNTQNQKRYFIRLLNNEASFTALDRSPFLAVGKDSAA